MVQVESGTSDPISASPQSEEGTPARLACVYIIICCYCCVRDGRYQLSSAGKRQNAHQPSRQQTLALDRAWEPHPASEPFASPASNVSEPFVVVRFRSSLDSRGLTLERVQSGLSARRCSQHLYCSSCTRRAAEAARAAARVTRTARGIHGEAAEHRSWVQLSSAEYTLQ